MMMDQRSLLVPFLFACGGGTDPGAAIPSTAAELPDLGVVYRAPRGAIELSSGAIEFAAEAIAATTNVASAGSLRAYGTLTEASDGRLSYVPTPTDRLVIDRPKVHLELALLDVEGSGADAASFFRAQHRMRVRYLKSEQIVGEVWSLRNGSTREIGIMGRVRVEERWWDASLRRSGTESFDVDQSGSRFYDDHELSGELSADGDRIEAREHWTYEMVAARGVGSRTESASSAVRIAAHVATLDGARFEWVGVRTQKAFRDGKPTELDTFWKGSGSIVRNGAPFGTVEKFVSVVDGETGGFAGFRIVTSAGAIELERHQSN